MNQEAENPPVANPNPLRVESSYPLRFTQLSSPFMYFGYPSPPPPPSFKISSVIIKLFSQRFMQSFKIVVSMCRNLQQWGSLWVTHSHCNGNVRRQGASDLIAATLLGFDSVGRWRRRAAMTILWYFVLDKVQHKQTGCKIKKRIYFFIFLYFWNCTKSNWYFLWNNAEKLCAGPRDGGLANSVGWKAILFPICFFFLFKTFNEL